MKTPNTYAFEKLDVWKLSRNFRKEIHEISSFFPREEMFGLAGQIRRASASISDNLAEGSGRATNIDKARFTNLSYSSAMETINHLVGAYDLGYISEEQYNEFRITLDEIIRKLNGLYWYQTKEEKSLNKP